MREMLPMHGSDAVWMPIPVVRYAPKITQHGRVVLILTAKPTRVRFYIGIKNARGIRYLRQLIKPHSGVFGLRIWDEEMDIFALPVDLTVPQNIQLEGGVVTSADDPNYTDIPLYTVGRV